MINPMSINIGVMSVLGCVCVAVVGACVGVGVGVGVVDVGLGSDHNEANEGV
jgi:hypothetical protein